MARLQDFSDVTPSSSSDKLLIVQSAGQGLATLDTAGQQIANNTSVSQLHTTSKTLAGAINEHDSEIGTLSSLTTSVKSSLVGAVNSIIAGLQGSEQNIITPTASGVTNYTAFGNSWYVQRGKLVWVHVGVQGLTPNASHTITTLPTALRPMTNVCSGGQGGETYTAYATASVATDGTVKVASVDHYAIVDILYFAKA